MNRKFKGERRDGRGVEADVMRVLVDWPSGMEERKAFELTGTIKDCARWRNGTESAVCGTAGIKMSETTSLIYVIFLFSPYPLMLHACFISVISICSNVTRLLNLVSSNVARLFCL